MAYLTVYVREDYYYEEGITATFYQDRLYENTSFLELRRGYDVITSMQFDSSLYALEGSSAILNSQLKKYGMDPELKYTVKTFTYIITPARRTGKITFEVTGDNETCNIRYSTNDSSFSRCVTLLSDFHEIVPLRHHLDTLFYHIVGAEYK